MREIILDTETTGLDPNQGHRIVEIGCVEIHNHLPTGNTFHTYVNPERDMPQEAFAVHGLSEEFLASHPVFASIADKFLDFIGEVPLVIHNAEFDMRFLNAEMKAIGHPLLARDRSVDTVALARRKFPGAQVNLDALCRRFEIDLSRRDKHGALLDAELLAEVYLNLRGGRQPGLDLAAEPKKQQDVEIVSERVQRQARSHTASAEELNAHEELLDSLPNPLWRIPD